MAQPVRTRFAPSPTGYLHVGGARTALFNYLLARNLGGQYLLRIEDTDIARSTETAVHQLIDDLRWLNLNWDNEQLVFQSKRQHLYNDIITDLLKRDLAYEAWESQEELTGRRAEAERQKKPFIYRRPNYTSEQLSRFKAEGRTPIVRLVMPAKEYRFRDEVLNKEVVLGPDEAQDFVIRKADGMPTYHFAVVVDDADMKITHVLRGQEHLKNTFNHLALQEALGYPRPTYAHLTTIQNLDGSKMGKRDRDKKIRERVKAFLHNTKAALADVAGRAEIEPSRLDEWVKDSSKQLDLPEQGALIRVIGMKESELPEILVNDFRKSGYLPEALLNFLALLGWSPGGDRERMTMEEMIALFSLERVGVANPKFSRDKLLAFNTEALKATPPERLIGPFRHYLAANPDSPLNSASDTELQRLIQIKPGVRTLRELDEPTRFFFIPDEQISYDPKAVEKVLKKDAGQGLQVLRDLQPLLEQLTDWRAPVLEQSLSAFGAHRQLDLGKLAQPLRVALTGTTISPPIFETLEFLGKPRTLNRIRRCV